MHTRSSSTPLRKIILLTLAFTLTPGMMLQAQSDAEAREDSLKMAEALHLQSQITFQVTATGETRPVKANLDDDAADDPAIWVHPRRPGKSLILGTNKKAGLYVYDMKGRIKQFMPTGRINNVDVRDGFRHQGREMALVAASNRTLNAISLYLIDPRTGIMTDTVANIPSRVDEVYGLCTYHNHQTNRFYAIVNGKNGVVEQWEITSNDNDITWSLTQQFAANSQPEGMAADDRTGLLYLGVEDEGIYVVNLNDPQPRLTLLPQSTSENPAIRYDIEGLALFNHAAHTYLVASIQGNFSYAVFNVTGQPRYVGSFVVKPGCIDGIEETDGLDITTRSCGGKYKQGMFVAQDGFNTNATKAESQNFKMVPVSKILPLLK
ncbi:MAG: phytase [Marinilabiliaceae bacterium]|nr:phytase [Marinilabiliaceae bacterium]